MLLGLALVLPIVFAWNVHNHWRALKVRYLFIMMGVGYTAPWLYYWGVMLNNLESRPCGNGPCVDNGMELIGAVLLPLGAMISFLYATVAAGLTIYFLRRD
ncbi:hypothetical protein GCM10011494_04510 [Novosphingobium endophyticum]|uniref:Uncharacterized protein n=1 Tax=Novosphingobium endophyticum TaxID=1955250 RepID=A0A916TP39_9SPHN|nr:hypothetical protein GCM10011494_04510 [Novosphingobium endophyticum]